jgi:hypothetical protein
MTTLTSVNITPLPTLQPAIKPSPAIANVQPTTATSAPASIVTLGQEPAATSTDTYSSRGLLSDSVAPLVLENQLQDKLTLALQGNISSSSTAGRFHGLGAALLAQLSSGSDQYSQSVVKSSAGTTLNPVELAADQSKLHTDADNSISLTIKTASGSTVLLNLSSQDDGLAVQMQVTGGTLSEAERSAVGDLADAFQSAIDGFTATPPRLDLGKLSQFNPAVLSSVDLSATLKLGENRQQTLSFHADGQQKTMSMSGDSGNLQLSVDTKNPAILGTAQQQAKALQSYLSQFDAARSRGNGNADLMTLFKDAFTALNSNGQSQSQALNQADLKTPSSISPSKADRGALTGLADFSASVSENTQASNPMRKNELDAFSYTTSQTTSIKGTDPLNRSIDQNQQAHLTASYHQSLYPGSLLKLDTTKASQNYNYIQVDDKTSSSTAIAYADGILTKASSTQESSQSTHTMRYELGHLINNTTTPSKTAHTQDLLNLLESGLQTTRTASTRSDN